MQKGWWMAIGILLSQGLGQGADPSADIKRLLLERRSFMAELGATLRAAWEKFDTDDLATLDHEVRRIRDAAPRIPTFFPPASFDRGSRARETISEQQEEFHRLSRDLQKAAEALVEQARTQDQQVIRTQLLRVGSACRACHSKFLENPR